VLSALGLGSYLRSRCGCVGVLRDGLKKGRQRSDIRCQFRKCPHQVGLAFGPVGRWIGEMENPGFDQVFRRACYGRPYRAGQVRVEVMACGAVGDVDETAARDRIGRAWSRTCGQKTKDRDERQGTSTTEPPQRVAQRQHLLDGADCS
jgi:hypothetical protein